MKNDRKKGLKWIGMGLAAALLSACGMLLASCGGGGESGASSSEKIIDEEALAPFAYTVDGEKCVIYGVHDSSMTEAVIPDCVTGIGEYAFFFLDSLRSVEIPNRVTSIGDYAFSGCRGLTDIEIPDSVTSIGDSAFSGCSGLTSIKLSLGLTSIGDCACLGCNDLTIYYSGTEEEWSAISISDVGNGNLTAATIYYYSEEQPTGTGNYWHYDGAGNPVPW